MSEEPTKQSVTIVTKSLGFLGLIPFAASIYWVLAGITFIDYDPKFLFLSYSAIILSFLGGTLWGRSIQLDESPTGNLLLFLSNGAAIIAWVSLLLGFEYYILTLTILMVGYAALLIIEYRGYQTFFTDVEPAYMQMRLTLTSLVLAAHLALMFILL